MKGEQMLTVDGLSKTFVGRAGETLAIKRLDFEVREGEIVCVVGPSGCGKTTLLKCISGLMTPTSGESRFRGKVIDGPPPGIAVVFQDYSRSLFAWLTVRKNVSLPLRRKQGVGDKDHLVEEALAAVGLTKFKDHYPWQLSGGMQQRVAIARALAYQPEILVMDEPFASVDAQTRADLEDLVLRVCGDLGITLLLVTHDIEESVYMADRVIVLSSPPSSVREILTVELPRPRDQVTTKELPEFSHLRGHVYRTVRATGPKELELEQVDA